MISCKNAENKCYKMHNLQSWPPPLTTLPPPTTHAHNYVYCLVPGAKVRPGPFKYHSQGCQTNILSIFDNISGIFDLFFLVYQVISSDFVRFLYCFFLQNTVIFLLNGGNPGHPLSYMYNDCFRSKNGTLILKKYKISYAEKIVQNIYFYNLYFWFKIRHNIYP